MTVDELQVLITANTNELRKEIGNANKSISGLQKSASKSTNGVMHAFKALKAGIIALGIGKVIKDSIQLGMDAIESDSLFETSLGNKADAVRSWSDEVSNALGLNAVALRKNTGVIYNMTTSMGLAGDSALTMSKGVSLLAEDMASFYNLDSAEAFNKLRSGLTGETEPLKQLGILVDDNTIKQVAYSEGIANVGSELTQQQKVMARYVAILKQTGNAQGDLARTIDSPANQIRILKNQITQLGITLSNFFMPILNAVLPYINAFAKLITQAVKGLSAFLGLGGKGDASKETEKVNTNVEKVESGLDGANNSAKKLKKTLAGFDEMNVLQDNSDSGSGSGSGTGTDTGFNLDEYDAHLDWVNDKTSAIVENIKKMFSTLGDKINWNKLKASFTGLWKAIQPLAKKVWQGLKWGFDNILVPITEWSVNDLLPALFESLGKAFEGLAPVLDLVGESFGYLFDHILKPLATGIGKAVIDVIEGIGDAFEGLGNWLDKNKDKISGTWAKMWDQIGPNLEGTFANINTFWDKSWQDMSDGVAKWGEPIMDGVLGLFTSISDEAITPFTEHLTQTWEDCSASMVEIWDEHGATLINNVGEFINNIIAAFQSLWDNIIEPIVTPFLQMLKDVWDKYLKDLVKEIADFVMTVINFALEIWNGFIHPIIMWIQEKLQPVFQFLGKVISSVFGSIIGVISSVISGIIGFFKGIINFFRNVFKGDWDAAWQSIKDAFAAVWNSIKKVAQAAWDGIKGVFSACGEFFLGVWEKIKNAFSNVASWFKNIFKKAWDGIKNVFSKVGDFFGGIWDTIKEKFSAIGQKVGDAVSGAFKKAINWVLEKAVGLINGFIKGINWCIKVINKIPGVEINKLKELDVPQMARGGIVDSPTLAVVGEAGKEAVMPLERNTGWIDQLASKLGEKIGGGAGNIKLIVKLGEDDIFNRFIEYGQSKAFETNGEVVFA